MFIDVFLFFDEVSDEELRSNSCFGLVKKVCVWVNCNCCQFFFVVFIFFDLIWSCVVYVVQEWFLKFKVFVVDF